MTTSEELNSPAPSAGRLKLTRIVATCLLIFAITLPIVLIAWARATADTVRIPPVDSPLLGLALTLPGAALLFPRTALSRLLPHPAYTGFSLICTGVSIALGSASGLWLVSPIVALSCVALAFAHESALPLSYPRLSAFICGQFASFSIPPHQESLAPPPKLLPQQGSSPPTGRDRLSFCLFVLLPWLALYEAVLAIGMPPDAISGVSRFEQRLPVLEWSQIIYASTYIMTLLAPFLAKTRSDLRRFSVHALWTMLLAYPAFLIVPLIAPKRPFTPHTLPGRLLLWERTLDSPVAAFPSFHVIWSLLVAEVLTRRWPRLKALFYGWAFLVAVSCVTTSQHSILDVLGGALTVALLTRAPHLWSILRRHAGRSAGSQREWRFRQFHFTRHGLYAGAGSFAALWCAETLAGPLFGAPPWLILAALSTGIAWGEMIAVHSAYGKRYHATPLYSVLCNGAIGLILTRLWMVAAPLHLIAGLFLILSGLARFVENSGMRVRQGLAVSSVLAGALITALGHSAPAPAPHFAWASLIPAAIVGLAIAVATGIDFRESNHLIPRIGSVDSRHRHQPSMGEASGRIDALNQR